MKNKVRSAVDVRYVAGLFDGEGTIGLYEMKQGERRQRFNPAISFSIGITNTHGRAVFAVRNALGGRINVWHPRRKAKNGRKHKTIYHWYASRKESARILRQLLPFLIIKRKQAELAIRFHGWFEKTKSHKMPGVSLPASEIRKRRAYVRKMKQLKHLP